MPNGLEKLLNLPSLKNLPPLKEISEMLRDLPDERKLRLVKQILDSVVKIKGSAEELEAASELVRIIANANIEQLTAIRDITANILKLVKYFPKEALKELPLKEIMEEFRKGSR